MKLLLCVLTAGRAGKFGFGWERSRGKSGHIRTSHPDRQAQRWLSDRLRPTRSSARKLQRISLCSHFSRWILVRVQLSFPSSISYMFTYWFPIPSALLQGVWRYYANDAERNLRYHGRLSWQASSLIFLTFVALSLSLSLSQRRVVQLCWFSDLFDTRFALYGPRLRVVEPNSTS